MSTESAYVQQKATHPASDWHYALLFSPAPQRAAAHAFHAFRTDVRSATENVRDPGVAHAKLNWWRGEIDALFAGTPTHPATQALAPYLAEFDIARGPLLDIVAGAEMDLTQYRYFHYAELQRYCALVSGAAAAVWVRIFSAAPPPDYDRRLGLALYLATMIRDVGHDASRSRIYLPADEMDAYNVRESEILAGTDSERFQALMRFQVERARAACTEALAALPVGHRRAQKPALTLLSIARQLLRRIEAEHHQVLEERRIDLPRGRKFWLAWKMQALGRF